MDDIEIQIVKDYFAKNKKFMEEDWCQSTMNLKSQDIIYTSPRSVWLSVCMYMPVTGN